MIRIDAARWERISRVRNEQATPLVAGAALVLSHQLLVPEYTGPCMRVRRGIDHAEEEFGFGMGDLARMQAWCRGGDGFVVRWYDQSGFARHAQQPQPGQQPRVVVAGSGVFAGETPSLLFSGAQMLETGLTDTIVASAATYFCALASSGSNGWAGVVTVRSSGGASSGLYLMSSSAAAVDFGTSGSWRWSAGVSLVPGDMTALAFSNGGGRQALIKNGQVSSRAIAAAGLRTGALHRIGQDALSATRFLTGRVAEIVVHATNLMDADVIDAQADQRARLMF